MALKRHCSPRTALEPKTPESNKSVFQFLRNFHQLTAFEQAEMILYAALDPSIAS
jgi:hypothetical protein